MADKARPSKIRKILKWILYSLLALVAALVVTILFIARSQDGSARLLQIIFFYRAGYEANSFSPRAAPADKVLSDGKRVKSDLRYETHYPNSYLDIWYSDANDRARRPTIINIHGGGWFLGDKATGDPLASGDPKPDGHVVPLAGAGFNVVNINYALSPEYRYPVAIRQLNEAIQFLIDHAGEYGLDMSNVIITGGSGGAHMTAQYGLIVSDPDYAAEVGIKPALRASDVKGVGILSAPLKFSGFGWRASAIFWSYLGTKDLEGSPAARQNDIIAHVSSRYPPTYITDGNDDDTFPDQAKAMARILREKNVDHEFYFTEKDVAVLGHGYTSDLSTEYGLENLRRMTAFFKLHSGMAE
jgi:acetyl esterase